jgi:steroid Delta-isomerase
MMSAEEITARHVATFNAAVRSGDFGPLLAGFTDDASVRFENVPGAGVLQFDGRASYTAAYAEQPPDDEIDVVGPVRWDGDELVIPFAWRSTGDRGTMRLTYASELVSGMVVTFA